VADEPHVADLRIGARVPDLLVDIDGEGPAGPTHLYKLLRTIGPGRFVRLDLRGGAGRPNDEGAESADTASDMASDQPLFEVVTVTARSVLGPDWAAGEGWGGAEVVLIRPDGHVGAIGAVGNEAAAAQLGSVYGLTPARRRLD
jgi:hypothetical protein